MTKPMLWMMALLAWPGSVLLGQTLVGTWQGTLNPGKELRIVMKISTTEGDALKAVMYSIDQGGAPVPASGVTRQGAVVKMSIPGIGGAYEGKLSADGKTIVGNWTQGPKPLPLTLEHVTEEAAWAIPEPPAKLKPMAEDANPAFEVATIKPSNPDRKGKGLTFQGRNFITINTSLSDLITFAYGLHPKQIAGAPAWVESDKYDLMGKPEGKGCRIQCS